MGKLRDRVSSFSLFEKVLSAAVLCLLLWCCVPMSVVGFNAVLAINLLVCLLLLFAIVFWHEIKAARGRLKIVRNISFVLVGVLACGYIGMSASMLYHAAIHTQEEAPTVIVLGCKINGESPSLMLARRLNTARDFMLEHPQSQCIVSGGQGDDEIIPESEAMKKYLVAAGIEPDRIFTENLSTDTRENMAFSKELIDKLGMPENVVIATDDFHQWRAQTEGERLGLACASAGACRTPWYMLSYYWTREILALSATLLL